MSGGERNVKILLEAGLSPRSLDHDGCPPLWHALLAEQKEALALLLPLSDVTARDARGRTLMHVVRLR